MKLKRTIIVTAILCVLFTASAFAVDLSTKSSSYFRSEQNDITVLIKNVDNALTKYENHEEIYGTIKPIQISQNEISTFFENAEIIDNTLLLYINYESYGEFYEIVRPISVAADSDFTQMLDFKYSSCFGDGWREYKFEISSRDQIDSIYVRPAILYMPTKIESVSMPVSLNASVSDVLNTSSRAEVCDSWFSISSIDVDQIETGLYKVLISITPQTDDFPRFPTLTIGEKSYIGATSMRLNENGDFYVGWFVFFIQAINAETVNAELKNASITVEYAMMRTVATNTVNSFAAFSSSDDVGLAMNIVVD